MVIKYFDNAQGTWNDVTGNIGDTLIIDASGFVTSPLPTKPYKSLVIINLDSDTNYDIIENDFDNDFTITQSSGVFSVTADTGSPFTDGKTAVYKATSYDDDAFWFSFNHKFIDETQIDFIFSKYGTPEGAQASGLYNATIEIRVYP